MGNVSCDLDSKVNAWSQGSIINFLVNAFTSQLLDVATLNVACHRPHDVEDTGQRSVCP